MTESIELYKKFLHLKQKNILPPKVVNKLLLLSQSITGQKHQFNKEQLFLSNQEIESFNQIPKEVRKSLFCQIVQSLLVQETKVKIFIQKEVAYLRKNFEDSIWVKCLLTLDQEKISLFNQKNQVIIKEISIKKVTDLQLKSFFKGKFQIFFNYKKNPIWIGFDSQQIPLKIISNLKKVKQNSVIDQKTHSKLRSQIIESQNQNDQKIEQIQAQKRQYKKRLLQEQNMLKEFVFNFVTQNKSQYKLMQIGDKGRFLKNTECQKTKFKISLLLQDVPLNIIIQSYMKMKEWNTYIEDFEILSKVSQNSYNALIIFKKRNYLNYFQYPKGSVINITATGFQNKVYLIFKNINLQYESKKYFQNFPFTQIIQISTRQNTNYSLMNIIFESQEKKLTTSDENWISQFLKYHLKNLPSFLLSKSIEPQQNYIFDHIQVNNFQIQQILKSSLLEQSENSQKTIASFQNSSQCSQKQQIQNLETLQKASQKKKIEPNNQMKRKKTFQMIQSKQFQIQNFVIQNEGIGSLSEYLLQLIKNKQHQKYYLKHHFDQNPHIDLTKFEYQQYQQFFYQNGRFKMTQKKHVVFCDQQAIQRQKDIIVYIIKKAGSAILSGQSIMNMSLPVEIFQPRSTTERMAISLSSSPKYLVKAGQLNDSLQQLKILMQFLVSLPTLMVNVQKAFNPILGQTLQVRIAGIPFYIEQICHHPPITAIYSKSQTFQFSGSFNSYLSLGLNHAVGKTLHLLKVKFFKTQTQFEIKLFDIEASGLIYGDRTIKPTQKSFAYQINKNLYGQVALGKHKKLPYTKNNNPSQNDFQGGLYLVNNNFKKRFLSTKMKVKFQGIKQQDIVQQYGHLKGTWFGQMFINNEKVRDLSNPLPNKLQFLKYVLPSDSNLREDVIYKRLGKNKQSNAQKQRLENIQRRDRKLRQGKKV